MSEIKTRLEGTVTSAKTTGSHHLGTKIPFVKFSIKNGSEKEESAEMPMNLLNEMATGTIVGQRIVYEEKRESAEGSFSVNQRFSILSGPYNGFSYEYADRF